MKNRGYLVLIIVGFIGWLIETAAFGWNDKPESTLEKVLDFVFLTMIFWGIIGDLLSNVTIVKSIKERKTYNIKTDKIELNPTFGKDTKVEQKGGKVSMKGKEQPSDANDSKA